MYILFIFEVIKPSTMTPAEYISAQDPSRQKLLSDIHAIILAADTKVEHRVNSMMGKEMIMYECKGFMKYALSSVKNHMSLHLMPIYSNALLHEKYKALLPDAKFQKGCINFKNSEEVPLAVVKRLFLDCAAIDWVAMIERFKRKK